MGKQLEAPRNGSLKKARRIVLLADGLQVRFVRWTVRRNRILETRGVIQEFELVEKTGGLCGFVDAVDQRLRDSVDSLVILDLTPGHRETEDY